MTKVTVKAVFDIEFDGQPPKKLDLAEIAIAIAGAVSECEQIEDVASVSTPYVDAIEVDE